MTDPASDGRAAFETLAGTVVFTFAWAVILNGVLNTFHSGILLVWGIQLYDHPGVFLLSSFVIWVLVLSLVAILGRLWLSCGLLLAATLVAGIIDRVKLRVRLEPIYPTDVDFLRSPSFLFTMVSPWAVIGVALALLLVVGVVVWLGRIPTRTFRPIRRHATPRTWWLLIVVRGVVVALSVGFVAYAGSFNSSGNRLRLMFQHSGVQWAFWNQNVNYRRNGLVPGFLYNMYAEAMTEPSDYSEDTMDALAAKWVCIASKLNRQRPREMAGINVVSVLSEAFSDPTRVRGVQVHGDPIPFTRRVMSETTSGNMLAQLYGGGTANMEFEAMTGQSLALFEPQVTSPYQQFVHRAKNYPSIIGYLHRAGYRAVAVHPYITAMYDRRDVYRVLGFDGFVHDSTMRESNKLDKGRFISDESAFDEVLHQVDRSSWPLFVNLVTMQNHYPMKDEYDNRWPVSAKTREEEDQLAGYARGINYSDKALESFLTRLSRSPERTAVIFYGDHLPGIYSPRTYHLNGDRAMKSTPFFIWTNFKHTQLTTAELTSPVYFLPLLFAQLGVKVPPYYALLTQLYAKVPALEQGVRLGWSGKTLQEDQKIEELLHDYRLFQYDLSVGQRYSLNEMFPQRHSAKLRRTIVPAAPPAPRRAPPARPACG